MKVSANGINHNCEDNGAGETLLLIHGFGDNLKMWGKQVSFFKKSYRVLTYDVRGSGKTDRPKQGYEIGNLVADVFEIIKSARIQLAGEAETALELKRLTEPCHIVGYSMGGFIAREFAIAHSDMIKSLVLANSSLNLNPPSPESQERREEWSQLLEKGDMKKFAEIMTTSAFSPGFRDKDKKTFENYKKVKQGNKSDGIQRLMQALESPAQPPDLTKIKCPVLFIVGEQDAHMGPEQGKQAQAMIPHSKLVVLPTGHAAALEAPDDFNKAVYDFLAAQKIE